MELIEIATALYNMNLDMDYSDYEDTAEEEIKEIEKGLEILRNNKCDTLLRALENIAL